MSVAEAPVVSPPETEEDEPSVAHFVDREASTRGYIEGTPVTALCGAVFVPTRDPERYPVCEACLEVKRGLTS